MYAVPTKAAVAFYAICLSCHAISLNAESAAVVADAVSNRNNSAVKNTQTSAKVYYYVDDFDRINADTLGNGWLDCKSTTPNSFEPLGVYNHGVVIAKPFTRPGIYDISPWTHELEKKREAGFIFPGIGCAFRETNHKTVAVKVTWSGNFGVDAEPPVLHVEGTPLLYISPDNPRYGFGAWVSELYGLTVVFAGYIASPPENFEVIAGATLSEQHVSGTPREIELRAESPGWVTVWIDGKQVSFDHDYGLKPLKVDPTMIDSTLHGIAVDAHFVHPQDKISVTKSIESVTIEGLN